MRTLVFVFIASMTLAGCVTEGADDRPKPSAQEASLANLNLGAAYLRQGDAEGAVNKLQRAVDLDARNAQAQATLALAYERIGRDDEADKHYLLAIRYGGEDAVIDNLYGAYLCRNGRLDEAQTFLLRAAENPRYRTPEAAYTNAGICAVRGERWEEAEGFFRSALRNNPRYGDALWHMAKLSFDRDRDLQARAFIERLESGTALPSYVLWLGHQVENRLGNRAAAQRYAQRLKANFPDSQETAALLESERNGG